MFSRRITAAFDLGAHSLKYAAVENESGTIRSMWQRELLPRRTSAQQTLSGAALRHRVAELLSALQREQPATPTHVTTALQGNDTWFQYLEFPELSPTELKVAIHTAATGMTPYPLESMVLTHVPVPPLREAKHTAALVIAARREPANELSAIFEQCGFSVQRLELVPLALAREFGRNHPQRASAIVALINVGFGLTHVVVARAGVPYYVREFALAGSHFTYGVQMAEHLSWAEAESRKDSYDVTQRSPCYEPFVLEWLEEVGRSLLHFDLRVAGHTGSISHVYLSGGGAAWRGLAERLAQHLQQSVEVDDWDKLHLTPVSSMDDCAFKPVVGMALEP